MPTEKSVTNFVINKVPTKAIFEKMKSQGLINDDEIYLVEEDDNSYLSYEAQSLTTAQQNQARTSIGAFGGTDILSVARGGTGSSVKDTALKNLGGIGHPIILDSNDYGTTTPSSMATGRLFFNTSAPVADYIVEYGTSGNWVYRKWNSGVAELSGYVNTGILSTPNTEGSLYFKPISVSYPSILSEIKTINATLVSGTQGAWIGGVCFYSNGLKISSAGGYVWTAVSSAFNGTYSYDIHVEITGRWK